MDQRTWTWLYLIYSMTNSCSRGKEIENSIEKVVDWFDSKDYIVTFSPNITSQIHPDGIEGEVAINTSVTRRTQLYTLLHEAGHYIVGRRRNYILEFGKGYPAMLREEGATGPNAIEKTDIHRIHMVHEEFAAWEAAKKLAKKLKIVIDHAAWDRLRVKNMMTYVVWAAATTNRAEEKMKAYASGQMPSDPTVLDSELDCEDHGDQTSRSQTRDAAAKKRIRKTS